MNRVLVDTNVLIDFTKSKNSLLENYIQDKNKWELWVNPVIVAEFLNDQWLTNTNKRKKAENFINRFQCLTINKEEGFIAGELIRTGKINYLGDALVAASCLVEKIPLLTRNQKHFKNVGGLDLLG